jgi:hypothetical protein
MCVRDACARVLVAVGLLFVRLAMKVGGGGRYAVELEVEPMYPEPVWAGLAVIVGLPVFWVAIVVLFAATGTM